MPQPHNIKPASGIPAKGPGHGGPAKGRGIGGPAKGASDNPEPRRPEFQPGNTLSTSDKRLGGETFRRMSRDERYGALTVMAFDLAEGAEGEANRAGMIRYLMDREMGTPIARNLVQNLDRNGDPTDPAAMNVMALAMDRLSTDELRVLVSLYRKMGLQLPHESHPPTIDHEDDDNG